MLVERNGVVPQVDPGASVAPTAAVVGDVAIAAGAISATALRGQALPATVLRDHGEQERVPVLACAFRCTFVTQSREV